MQVLLTIAAILSLTALFSYINERFLRLQQTIGLMLLALGLMLVVMLLNAAGLGDGFAREQAFVTRLSLDATLLNGVLCFMLFAGSINPTFEWIRLAQRVPVRVHLEEVPGDVALRVGTTASVLVRTGTGGSGQTAAIPVPAALQ